MRSLLPLRLICHLSLILTSKPLLRKLWLNSIVRPTSSAINCPHRRWGLVLLVERGRELWNRNWVATFWISRADESLKTCHGTSTRRRMPRGPLLRASSKDNKEFRSYWLVSERGNLRKR